MQDLPDVPPPRKSVAQWQAAASLARYSIKYEKGHRASFLSTIKAAVAAEALSQKSPRAHTAHAAPAAAPERSRRGSVAAPTRRISAEKSAGALDDNAHAVSQVAVALSRHQFFSCLPGAVVEPFARVCQRRVYQTDVRGMPPGMMVGPAAGSGSIFAPPGTVLIAEGAQDLNSDYLWIIDKGRVAVEEQGEVLGELQEGCVFGDFVAFGCSTTQPLTVKLTDSSVVLWCIPNAAINSIQLAKYFSNVYMQMCRQWKDLFFNRMRGLTFFSHCNPHCMDALHRRLKMRSVKPGEVLCKEGEAAETALFVVSGALQVLVNALPARRRDSSVRSPVGMCRCPSLQDRVQEAKGISVAKQLARQSLKPTTEEPALTADVEGSESGGSSSGTDSVGESDSGESDCELSGSSSESQASDWGGEVYTSLGATSALSDSDDDSEKSSSDLSSASSEHEVEYSLPDHFACLEPLDQNVFAQAGTGEGSALLLGDAILLGFESTRTRTAIAETNCIVFELSLRDFMGCLRTHKAETNRFIQMQQSCYQESIKCRVSCLNKLDIFGRCSRPFLEALVRVAVPSLVFVGCEVIAQGSEEASKDLVLLMAGNAEKVRMDGTYEKVNCPQTFGSLQWLGALMKVSDAVVARSLCQVLFIKHAMLLDTLKKFPDESTNMVQQVRQHNGHRLTLVTSKDVTGGAGSPKRNNRLQLCMWHLPFCKGCDPGFLEWFTMAMAKVNLIPGMSMLHDDVERDFMVLLTEGTVEVTSSFSGSKEEVVAPLMICGWDKNRKIQTAAKTICEIQHLSVRALSRLAGEFPENTRLVVTRLMQFQTRNHGAMGVGWWSAAAALRRLAPFEESSYGFLLEAAKLLELQVFLPGDALVEEGASVDCTLILESGTCAIEKRSMKCLWTIEVVAEVSDGCWIGGVGGVCGFAGELKRSATVRATTVCKVHRIPTEEFVTLLGSNSTERQRFRSIAERELRAKDRDRLEDHSFFAGLPRRLLNLLRPKCRVHVFFANEALFNEGDPAESMIILSADATVSLEANGERIKEMHGRQCLGVLALLSQLPNSRNCTCVTLTACAVRMVTKEDWLDALKLYPEHRDWINDFTQAQLAVVNEVRSTARRWLAAEKIQERDEAAKQAYWHRRAAGCGKILPRGPGSAARAAAEAAAGKAKPAWAQQPRDRAAAAAAAGKARQKGREGWPCFNGPGVAMPSTVLPRLNGSTPKPAQLMEAPGIPSEDALTASSGGSSDEDELQDEASPMKPTSSALRFSQSQSQRLSQSQSQEFDWKACDSAVGLCLEVPWSAPRPRASRGSVGARPSAMPKLI